MIRRVAFPVRYDAIKLHVDKGRQWSILEEIILHALCSREASVAELAEQGGHLPRRLVVEALIRLMRARWVELVPKIDHMAFRATADGVRVSKFDTLPAITRPVSRPARYAIDLITGTVFRRRDLVPISKARLAKMKEKGQVVQLPDELEIRPRRADEVFQVLLDEDEMYRNAEATNTKPYNGYALVTVNGKRIEGLPVKGVPDELKRRILKVVDNHSFASPEVSKSDEEETRLSTTLREITLDSRDIIMGGEEHYKFLGDVLRKAKIWVVIHSTFVRDEAFGQLLPLMEDAARQRGTRIDILWGATTKRDGSNDTAQHLKRCKAMISDRGLGGLIHIHDFTTASHAKIIIADDGKGNFFGSIGSCNWLYSGFQSYELSIRLRDTGAVAEVMSLLAEMTRAPDGRYTQLTRALAGHAVNLSRQKSVRSGGRRASICLVLGSSHNDFMLKARDEAQKRIVVASHRLGHSAQTAVLIPARAAAESKPIDISVYYGKTSGGIDGNAAAEMVMDHYAHGVEIKKVFRPNLHAKFIAWDNDHVVVTSQNMLSADPPDANPYAEIGIYIYSSDIAREIVGRAEVALETS